jgi:hypothetical protein
MAKSYLRSKKLLEELLVNRLKSLETIQTILLKLDTAAGDIEASHSILFNPPHSGSDNPADNAYIRNLDLYVKDPIGSPDVAT